jgi:hypothetical protein
MGREHQSSQGNTQQQLHKKAKDYEKLKIIEGSVAEHPKP